MLRAFKQHLTCQKGQSLVEFALVLPVFIVILFGIIEFGRIWETVNVMTSAAREGARIAAIYGSGSTTASQTALNVLADAQIENATVSIEGPTAADEIIVTVTVTYASLTGSLVPGVGALTLTRSTTMHWEG